MIKMKRNPLIPFRAAALAGNNKGQGFTVNGPIYFSDGSKGIIRSIVNVEVDSRGIVWVIGKFRGLSND